MDYKIIWSPQAEISFELIIDYLTIEWTNKEIENLILQTQSKIALIAKSPYLFRSSEKENIHEVLITKHNLLLYQISETNKKVELLAFLIPVKTPKRSLINKIIA